MEKKIFVITAMVGIWKHDQEISPFRIVIREFPIIKETAKSYIYNGRQLKKDQLNKIDSKLREDMINFINYHIVCLEEGIEEAKETLKNKIIEEVEKRKKITLSLEQLVGVEPEVINKNDEDEVE